MDSTEMFHYIKHEIKPRADVPPCFRLRYFMIAPFEANSRYLLGPLGRTMPLLQNLEVG